MEGETPLILQNRRTKKKSLNVGLKFLDEFIKGHKALKIWFKTMAPPCGHSESHKYRFSPENDRKTGKILCYYEENRRFWYFVSRFLRLNRYGLLEFFSFYLLSLSQQQIPDTDIRIRFCFLLFRNKCMGNRWEGGRCNETLCFIKPSRFFWMKFVRKNFLE